MFWGSLTWLYYRGWPAFIKMITTHSHDKYTCSPTGFYFVSGSHDRTARVWSTEHIQPIRILAGHLSDVDVRLYPSYSKIF